jgi:hypothetical protein
VVQRIRNLRKAVLAILASGLCAAGASAAQANTGETLFSFVRAEFMSPDQGRAAAEAFVARELPAGLPLPEAVMRLQQANMHCGAASPTGVTECTYAMPVGSDGYPLHDDVWTVRLNSNEHGTLAVATLDCDRPDF